MLENKQVILFICSKKYLKFAAVFIQKVHQKFTDDFVNPLLKGEL